MKGNFQDDLVEKNILLFFDKKIDVVLSDMAANTTGNKEVDAYRTGELCLNAMNLATKILNKDGVFLAKLFMGSIFSEINEKGKNLFKKVVKYSPTADGK